MAIASHRNRNRIFFSQKIASTVYIASKSIKKKIASAIASQNWKK